MKILTLSTLKNSQSSVTLKNERKQLRYCFPNEIKNSTLSNENILRLKQEANPLSMGFRGWSPLRKVLGSKKHLDWLKIDLNAL